MRLAGICFLALYFVQMSSGQMVIDSFSENGTLTATGLEPGSTSTVEWASSLSGPWTNSWDSLREVVVDANGNISVSVPMHYRVVGRPEQLVTFEWVSVGNPGNAYDTSGYGGVTNTYRISAHEVTNDQYTEFLNAVDPAGTNPNSVYNASMGSDAAGGISFNAGATNGSKYSVKTDMGNKPVNFVSFLDSMRFVYWLENGQGSGGTESGVYTIGTGLNETRAVNASYFIPSEDEWYKAAYHDPVNAGADGNGTADYWLYPTQSDTVPTVATADANGNVSNPGANVANYNLGADWNGQNGNVTTVGSATATSFYGAFDMGGNLREWNEGVIGSSRGWRGGSWGSLEAYLRSSTRSLSGPTLGFVSIGFRVASPQ